MTLTADVDYRCPATLAACYGVGGVADVFLAVQRGINKLVGVVPRLSPVAVDGKLGSATAEAAARVASYLLGKLAHAQLGSYLTTLSVVMAGRREILAAHAADFARVLDLYAVAHPSAALPAPPRDVAFVQPATASSSSAVSRGRARWWIAGAVALGGAGAMGFALYRRHAR